MILFIHDLYKKETTKPSSVNRHIDAARKNQNLFIDEENPTSRQLEYLLKKFKSQDGEKLINLGDLTNWCQNNSNYPNAGDEAFVLSHEITTRGKQKGFHFCITTPNLLEKLSQMTTICIDATYKLNWLGFPLILLGTVDRLKKFHPLLYACSSHETTEDYEFVFQSAKNGAATYFDQFEPKILIADGADQILNAFNKVFEDSAELVIMCFAHVIRNVRKRPFASKNSKQLIVDDIRKLQLSQNRTEFEMCSKLFIEKWKGLEPNFVDYFKREWLGSHCNWYEGAADYTPSTNNALESHNAIIKRLITFRRRLPLNEFLAAMIGMAQDISTQFTKGQRNVATEPQITRDTMVRAAEMECNGFQAFKAVAKETGRRFFVLPSEKCPEEQSSLSYYKHLKNRQWASFDEFLLYGYQMFWLVYVPSEQWKTNSTCTCPFFFKQHMCKHIVAIALKEGLCECPQMANPMLIAPKRKPGRTKNATTALMRS